MKARWHFLVTSVTSPVVLALTGSYVAVVLWFFFGFSLDGDHLLEYVLREKRLTFSAYTLSNLPYPVLFLPLHCLELVPLSFVLFYLFLPQYTIVTLIYLAHMLMDVINLREYPLIFFGFYRLWKWKRNKLEEEEHK